MVDVRPNGGSDPEGDGDRDADIRSGLTVGPASQWKMKKKQERFLMFIPSRAVEHSENDFV